MNEEILRCIDSMRGEISDTIAYLLTAEDGLRAVEERRSCTQVRFRIYSGGAGRLHQPQP